MNIEQIKQAVSPILYKYRVSYAGIFGSQARGEARPDSDIDILIRFEKIPSLVQFIRLGNELEGALKTDVDMVVEGSEKPLIKKAIEKDLTVVYG
jgi:predicted nucleotidyltransferase